MQKRPLTDNLPDYEIARRFLQILAGTKFTDYVAMMNDIFAHIGNPKSPVNWKDPDSWIPQRLTGESRKLALKLWRESDHLINPRHSYDVRALCVNHNLLDFSKDVVEVTDKGRRFIRNDDAAIRVVDQQEGIQFILSDFIENGLCKRLDMIESFTAYCRKHTTWQAHASIDSALSARFRHLRRRKFIERIGHAYQITETGLTHFRRFLPTRAVNQASIDLSDLARRANERTRTDLYNYVQDMHFEAFEHLIVRLLQAMGYENVEVTTRSHDKGVDVVGDVRLGVSEVREVIQAKRQKSNVQRPILDRLRGSLHRFDAVRGTIVTTSGFSSGAVKAAFEKGAAPITLIDGQTLVDMLIVNEIGIRRHEIKLMEFDEESLSKVESDFNSDQQAD